VRHVNVNIKKCKPILGSVKQWKCKKWKIQYGIKKMVKYSFLIYIVIIEFAHLQNLATFGGIGIQSKTNKISNAWWTKHYQNCDTMCPDFAQNLVHDPQSHMETQHQDI